MIWGAKRMLATDIQPMTMMLKVMVKMRPFFTRSTFCAWWLKAATGWKPWPMPRPMHMRKLAYRETTLMAAMAASPKGFVRLFCRPTVMAERLCRMKEGNPTRQMARYILASRLMALREMVLWAILRYMTSRMMKLTTWETAVESPAP